MFQDVSQIVADFHDCGSSTIAEAPRLRDPFVTRLELGTQVLHTTPLKACPPQNNYSSLLDLLLRFSSPAWLRTISLLTVPTLAFRFL